MNEIGITERGDAALDLSWINWVRSEKPAILITKDPGKLLQELLYQSNSKNFNIIIHTTITGMGSNIIEPNVPKKSEALTSYKHLCLLYGVDRVVLRIDPIIPTQAGIDLAKSVLEHKEPGGRVRISFFDQYNHVKERLKTAGITLPWESFHAPYNLRNKAYEELGRPEICGEPDFKCTGCVSELDCKTFKIEPCLDSKGQRKFCACLINKKELLNSKHPCGHRCLYCYWKNV